MNFNEDWGISQMSPDPLLLGGVWAQDLHKYTGTWGLFISPCSHDSTGLQKCRNIVIVHMKLFIGLQGITLLCVARLKYYFLTFQLNAPVVVRATISCYKYATLQFHWSLLIWNKPKDLGLCRWKSMSESLDSYPRSFSEATKAINKPIKLEY